MSFVSVVLMLALEVAYVTPLVQHQELDCVALSYIYVNFRLFPAKNCIIRLILSETCVLRLL